MEQSTYLYVKLTRTVANYIRHIAKESLPVRRYNTGIIYYVQVHLENNELVGLELYNSVSVSFEKITIISALEFKRILFDWSMSQ